MNRMMQMPRRREPALQRVKNPLPQDKLAVSR